MRIVSARSCSVRVRPFTDAPGYLPLDLSICPKSRGFFRLKGEPIGRLQSSLRDLGYYQQAPSGVFDGRTAEAVRAFQRDHFLDEDGILGPQTRIVLYQAMKQFPMPSLEGAS